ncbi:MAG: hypothetical protein ACI4QT_00510 [Kiritimatiellia bacterium]
MTAPSGEVKSCVSLVWISARTKPAASCPGESDISDTAPDSVRAGEFARSGVYADIVLSVNHRNDENGQDRHLFQPGELAQPCPIPEKQFSDTLVFKKKDDNWNKPDSD